MTKKHPLPILILLIITACSPDPCGELYLRRPNPHLDEVRTYLKTSDGDRLTDNFYTGRCGNYNTEGILLSIQKYQDGLDHGKWKFFYEKGQLETVGRFEKGKRDGEWKYYHQDGGLKQTSNYKNGDRYGIWTKYNKEGEIVWEESYSDGEKVDSLQKEL